MANSFQIGTFEVVLAIIAYAGKQWWDERRRIQLKREEAYLSFGQACVDLEVAVLSEKSENILEHLSGIGSCATSLHLFGSREVQEKADIYLKKLGFLAGLAPRGEDLKRQYDELAPQRLDAVEAMRKDVLNISQLSFLRWPVFGRKKQLFPGAKT